jgi:hypothetical protein
MASLLALLLSVAFGAADAQLRAYKQYKHKYVDGTEYCLTAVDPDQSGTGAGSLTMRKCENDADFTQHWTKPSGQMVSSHKEQKSGKYPCVAIVNIGTNVYALSYDVSDEQHCITGFDVKEEGGFWTLDNFLGTGTLGCIAANTASHNFYVATCGGNTTDTCKGVTVPGQPTKKCLEGWHRQGQDMQHLLV